MDVVSRILEDSVLRASAPTLEALADGRAAHILKIACAVYSGPLLKLAALSVPGEQKQTRDDLVRAYRASGTGKEMEDYESSPLRLPSPLGAGIRGAAMLGIGLGGVGAGAGLAGRKAALLGGLGGAAAYGGLQQLAEALQRWRRIRTARKKEPELPPGYTLR